MSTPTTPYTPDLAGREPIQAMRDTAVRIAGIVATWTPAQFERSYAPGKWNARLILIHLAQAELALGYRARMALTVPNYTAQSFDQDDWLAKEHDLSGRDAALSFATLSKMNVDLFSKLSPADRQLTLSHPEYGALTVDWVIHHMAGHQIHHLKHFEVIA